jgi:hypothetical protein
MIVSKSLLRTCQVVPGCSCQFSSRADHRNKPTAGPEDAYPCVNRIGPLRHLLLETEPTKQVARFAGHRFSDMKAGEFLLFENDRLDAFSGEKTSPRPLHRPSADNQHLSFHIDEKDLELPGCQIGFAL